MAVHGPYVWRTPLRVSDQSTPLPQFETRAAAKFFLSIKLPAASGSGKCLEIYYCRLGRLRRRLGWAVLSFDSHCPPKSSLPSNLLRVCTELRRLATQVTQLKNGGTVS
jgi:hypothetical protein